MAQIQTLRETIEAIAECRNKADVSDRYGWVYYSQQPESFVDKQFYLSSNTDESDDPLRGGSEHWPAFAIRHDMNRFLEVEVFADVLDAQKGQYPASQIKDYADALEHFAHRKSTLVVNASELAETDPVIAVKLSRRIYPEYDLKLAVCPPDRVGVAARALVKLQKITLVEAMARCRNLPIVVGDRVDAPHKDIIVSQFVQLGLPLSYVNYEPLVWKLDGK
ncbi:MAG: hypothetical protein LBV45_02795 [Xanthomonadaceae bacterium]|nr:hypothetical protein [Xanthomonadaceae bacterium]